MTTAALVAVLMIAETAPPATETARAKQAFIDGQKLYQKRRYVEAIGKFQEAHRLKPHPVNLFNLGRCYEQLGNAPTALRFLRDYLRLDPAGRQRAVVSETIAALERKLAALGVQQLVVLAEPEGARVEVDGRDHGAAPIWIELPPGEHRVGVSREGYAAREQTVVLPPDRSAEVSIVLKPAAALPKPPAPPEVPPVAVVRPPPPPPVAAAPPAVAPTPAVAVAPPPIAVQEPARGARATGPRRWTYVALGLGAAGAGAGAGLGLLSSSASAELRDGTRRDQASAQALHDRAVSMAAGANVAYGAAAAVAVAAAVMFFLEPGWSAPAAGGAGAD